jgi:hypothetical protein
MFLYRISSQSNISCVDVDADAGIGDSIKYRIRKKNVKDTVGWNKIR